MLNISINIKAQIAMCPSVTLMVIVRALVQHWNGKKRLLLIPSDDIDIGGDPPFTYTYTSSLPFCSIKHSMSGLVLL